MKTIKNDTLFMIVVVLGSIAGSVAAWHQVVHHKAPRVVRIETPPIDDDVEMAGPPSVPVRDTHIADTLTDQEDPFAG